MADTFSLATELAVLLAARRPNWKTQVVSGGITSAPQAATDGAYLDDAPRTLVSVALREDAHRRTARLSISSLSIGDDFTTTINGTAVVYDSVGDVDMDEVVAGIAAAINADGTVNQIVLATAVKAADDTVVVGTRDSVKITGLTETDYAVAFADNGTSVAACVADPTQATLRLWFTLGAADGVTAPEGWRRYPDTWSLTGQGFVSRFDVAGLDRMFAQLDGIDGHASDGGTVTYRTPDVHLGPAALET